MLPERLETERLVLRPIVRGDALAIFAAYAQDPEVVRYLTWRPHRKLADTEAYISRCLATPPERVRTYALIGRAESGLIGSIDLHRPEPHRIDFGYVLERPFWGRGLVTEALSAAARCAMAMPEIWRIGAVCDVSNPASARVMEKAGLTHEGILRRWIVHPNISAEPRDCFSYSLSR
jgi:[ribosomal protein S5]-alanine N-acetyltransferase